MSSKRRPSNRPQEQELQPERKRVGRPRNSPVMGEVIRAQRELLGYSREELARTMLELGAPATGAAIYKWEKGKSSPSRTRLEALCTALNLERSDVLAPA